MNTGLTWQRMLLLCVPLVISWAPARSSTQYELGWSTIDGGGGQSTSGAYELSGTIGQPDAGPGAPGSGGTYSLTGGFWFECVPGDCDQDGDVDLDDFTDLQACLLGPGGGLGSGCECFDLDGNGDVDLFDFAEFQVAFGGPL